MKNLLTPEVGERLEDFTTAIPDLPWRGERFDVALLLAGFKRATTWAQFSEPHSVQAELRRPSDEVTTEIIRFLESLGLLAEALSDVMVANFVPPRPYAYRRTILIAQDETNLELNRKLWGDSQATVPQDDRLFGSLAGFPQTAIDGFMCDESINPADIPEAIKGSPEFAFARFRLSRDHWQSELAEVSHWVEALKAATPHLYQEIVTAYAR